MMLSETELQTPSRRLPRPHTSMVSISRDCNDVGALGMFPPFKNLYLVQDGRKAQPQIHRYAKHELVYNSSYRSTPKVGFSRAARDISKPGAYMRNPFLHVLWHGLMFFGGQHPNVLPERQHIMQTHGKKVMFQGNRCKGGSLERILGTTFRNCEVDRLLPPGFCVQIVLYVSATRHVNSI